MNKICTVESRVNAMRAYTRSFDDMSPEDAKEKAIKALRGSKIIDETGKLNPLIFRESKYVKNQ